MVKYTLTRSPDVVLTVPGKDTPKARDKAMDQLIELIEAGEAPADLSDGFSPHQFIEVKDQPPMTPDSTPVAAQSAPSPTPPSSTPSSPDVSSTNAVSSSPPSLTTSSQSAEDAVTQAVQVLSNLATLKLKVQTSRTEAMKVRAQVDGLFSDDPVDEAELEQLKEGFKLLKTFAQANLRYREARDQAEQARDILDQALSFPDSKRKSEK